MEDQIISIKDLTANAVDYLHHQSLSVSGIKKYCSTWNQLQEFMSVQKLQTFNSVVGDMFIKSKFGIYKYEKLTIDQRHIIRRVYFLTEFQENGSVLKKRCNPDIKLDGAIGNTMEDFIAQRKSLGYSKSTIKSHKIYLSRFLEYLIKIGITSINEINHVHLITFVNDYGNNMPIVKHNMLSVIRVFFRYIYDQKYLDVDFSRIIPKDNYKRQSKLPSVYTKEEVTSLIRTIDRGNPKGKRDYAIILLAARLGLRSSDICNLLFENIDWKRCNITLTQHKTNKEIILPLTSEIGEALIDHLKYARPKSDLPFVFLNLIPPFDQMANGNLSTMVRNYLNQAGISTDARKKGMHILRHSLAGILLKDKTPLPVISEVLGHKDTGSTMYYLRIDIDSLSQCALEVPTVSDYFYENVSELYFNQKTVNR